MSESLFEMFTSIFGEYHPIIETVNGVETICCDWSYIAHCGFILISLYAVLRIVGGVINAK